MHCNEKSIYYNESSPRSLDLEKAHVQQNTQHNNLPHQNLLFSESKCLLISPNLSFGVRQKKRENCSHQSKWFLDFVWTQCECMQSSFDLLLVWGHNNVGAKKNIPSNQILRRFFHPPQTRKNQKSTDGNKNDFKHNTIPNLHFTERYSLERGFPETNVVYIFQLHKDYVTITNSYIYIFPNKAKAWRQFSFLLFEQRKHSFKKNSLSGSLEQQLKTQVVLWWNWIQYQKISSGRYSVRWWNERGK